MAKKKKKAEPESDGEQQEYQKSVLIPQKFRRDSEGNYWEAVKVGDRTLLVPAPDWAGYINFYLFEGPDIIIEATRKALCRDVPVLRRGADPVDGGNLLLSDDEKSELLRTDPLAEKFLRPYMMGKELLYNIPRWCLWLKGAEPADIRKCPHVLERIERVRQFRLSSRKEATRKRAETPALFEAPIESATDYFAIPKTSSERRKYIPMAWLPRDVIPGSGIRFAENVGLYHFGVLMSSVHNAWVRTVSGRLTSRISYSNTLDYNAFPWPNLPEVPWLPDGNPGRLAIEKTAQAILDARALYPRSSLADLYDERTMPPELRKAHNANDEAVMTAYGFERHYEDGKFHDEDLAIRLMYMYKDLTHCHENKRHYPNRKLWLKYYPEDAEDDEEVEYDSDYEEGDDLS